MLTLGDTRTEERQARQRQRRTARLLDQQMWCWGQDIERKEGNLLLRFGFHQVRPPKGVSGGSTAYVLCPNPACQLILWGFGVFFGLQSSGGIFVRRYGFTPLWSSKEALSETVWAIEQLPRFQRPGCDSTRVQVSRLTSQACQWIATYERWIAQAFGPGYRTSCLHRRSKAPVIETGIAEEWQEVSDWIGRSRN